MEKLLTDALISTVKHHCARCCDIYAEHAMGSRQRIREIGERLKITDDLREIRDLCDESARLIKSNVSTTRFHHLFAASSAANMLISSDPTVYYVVDCIKQIRGDWLLALGSSPIEIVA